MKYKNIISYASSLEALLSISSDGEYLPSNLKIHEASTLIKLKNEFLQNNISIPASEGFYFNYTIKQIGKEFDILRFSDDLVVNIEMKCTSGDDDIYEKIRSQMAKNLYYLKSLDRSIYQFCYLEDDGFYRYLPPNHCIKKVNCSEICAILNNQKFSKDISPDDLFIPSKYLISPFNLTEKFIKDEYFLTNRQKDIKKKIEEKLEENKFFFCCIEANAGTGKTLLLYDIAKNLIKQKSILIIHCAQLNQGHITLKTDYGWNIQSIKFISSKNISSLSNYECIFIDEAQRIRMEQFQSIISHCVYSNTPIIFAYDVKQYLSTGEDKNIEQILKMKYPTIDIFIQHLKSKIRTNEEMANFIKRLFDLNKKDKIITTKNVTIEYLDQSNYVKNYLGFLKTNNWVTIHFTPSKFDLIDPHRKFYNSCMHNAHEVIGQEFPNVAVVLDENFWYQDNKMSASKTHYSGLGMLYQIVTRVVENLKIIIYNNPQLYKDINSIIKDTE